MQGDCGQKSDPTPHPVTVAGAEGGIAAFGIADIDRGFARIHDGIRRCLDLGRGMREDQAVAEAIAAVVADITRHFAEEERLMRQACFPRLGSHILAHGELLGVLRAYAAITPVSERASRVGSFLAIWVRQHTAIFDRDFADWLGRIP